MMRTRDRRTGPGMTWLARVTVLALGAATLTVPLGIMTGAEAARLEPRTTAPTTTLAVIRTIEVGNSPVSVAVNDVDDTVYVTNIGAGTLSVIDGTTGAVASTLSVGQAPRGVAVNQTDDTLYVTNRDDDNVSVIDGRDTNNSTLIPVGSNPSGVSVNDVDDTVYVANEGGASVSVIYGKTSTVASTLPVGNDPLGVAVDQGDDTVYVTNFDFINFGDDSLSVINGKIDVPASTIVVGSGPRGVAVNQTDDTVYVVNSADDSVSVIDGKTNTVVSTIIAGDNPRGVAVDQTDDTVYVTNADNYTVSVINGRTNTVDATIGLSDGPNGVAVDGAGTNAGLIYVTRDDASVVSMIGRVVPSLSASSGSPGAAVTLSVAAPQVAYDVDDSTVTSVHFGDDTATGLTASAGTFTYSGSPTPTPPTPASAPRDVSATAGEASATVTWTAPASSGGYPITDYRAIASPGGRSCLVPAPALSCEVSGLTNGTEYTFTAQALTGAGWGATSSPSNAVTPEPAVTPTIVITGYRGTGASSGRVYANGTTTHLAGEIVRARVKVTGELDYRDGSSRTVSADETFTWQRKTGKTTYVYFTHAQARSNSITIPAR